IETSKILKLLSRSIKYYLKSWNEEEDDTGLFGNINPSNYNMSSVASSSPVIEYVISPHLNITTILASYLYLNETQLIKDIISKEEIIQKIRFAVRWACRTHLTGDKDVESFLERKRWGENWRSSLWATQLGLILVLAKNILDNNDKESIAKIIAFEANRFVDILPPTGCEYDTKIEENAIDTMLLCWAVNINPEHPNVDKWENALRLWAVNVASNIFDKTDHSEYFSSSVAATVTTRNLYPDMTAENHGFFNPEIFTYSAWIILAMSAYIFHNKKIPDFIARKNHQRTFEILLRFCLPDGLIYPVGGQDMPFFIPRPVSLLWGLWNNDPRALHITCKLLNWMDINLTEENSICQENSPWVFGLKTSYDGWELLFQSQVGFELALLAILPLTSEQRPSSAGQIENALDTRHVYPFVEVCYRRNIRATRSVAWKAIGNHPLIGFNLHIKSELTMPFKAALLGIPSVVPSIKNWKVAFHHDHLLRDGFDSSGNIVYLDQENKPLLSREIRVITWGDDGLVVFDLIKALQDVETNEHYLSPVYLVNDHWTGYKLEFSSGSLHEIISFSEKKYREIACPSFWASIDDLLLFQFIWGRSRGLYYLTYGERNAPPYWKNCRMDMLAVHVEPKKANGGTVIYKVGYYIGSGKGPKPFKCTGGAGKFFKGLVVMDGKTTIGLT
ncbi:MAG: hypothetical protein N2053_03250, partial [Chitinispirillaceae bacterium]|nr:hypothetical protein [Chitinispirillaceae bacterium]